MNHRATPRFWGCYRALLEEVRLQADRDFELLRADPRHPSLRFKKVGTFWSVRVGLSHRALAREVDGDFIWFWIGSHAEYERLIRYRQ